MERRRGGGRAGDRWTRSCASRQTAPGSGSSAGSRWLRCSTGAAPRACWGDCTGTVTGRSRIAEAPGRVLRERVSLQTTQKTWVALRSMFGQRLRAFGWRGLSRRGPRRRGLSRRRSRARGDRDRRWPGGDRGRSGLCRCRRARDARGGPPQARRRRLLVRARRAATDNGQHRCPAAAPPTAGCWRGLAASMALYCRSAVRIPVLSPGRESVVLRRGSLPAPLHLAGTLLRYRHLTFAQRLRAARCARARAIGPRR